MGLVVNALFNSARPTPPLERARQVFLAHPYIHAGLWRRSDVSLVMQMMWRGVHQCLSETGDLEARNAYCQQVHRAAYTLTSTMKVDPDPEGTTIAQLFYSQAEVAWTAHIGLESAALATNSITFRPYSCQEEKKLVSGHRSGRSC